jgi:recombination protein RecT
MSLVERVPTPVAEARLQLQQMSGQFEAALPAHIPVERFKRVVMTAIQNNPSLLKLERKSLWNACIRAAQDGLLPDGREGAIVAYGNAAQWMPMIAGLRKKVRNSGEIATWDAFVVYENDEFDYMLGDEPRIHHKPTLGDPGKVIGAYSIATLKTGEKTREVMSVASIEKVRQRSKAKNSGPWVTDYEEMCRKTVARRHSKVLPMSTDLDDLMRRDEELYDLKNAADENKRERPVDLAARLDALAVSDSHLAQDDDDNAIDDATEAVGAVAEETKAATPDLEIPAEFDRRAKKT